MCIKSSHFEKIVPQKVTILSHFDRRESWPFCALYSQFPTSFPLFFGQKCHKWDYVLFHFWWIFVVSKSNYVWWKCLILPNFDLRNTFELIDYFQFFVWNCQDFYLLKGCFICSKCSTFVGNQKPPQIPALLVEEGGWVSHCFSVKNLEIWHFLLILFTENLENIIWKHSILFRKTGSNSPKNNYFKGISKSESNLVRNIIFF